MADCQLPIEGQFGSAIDDRQSTILEKGQTRPAQGLSGRIVGLLYNPGRVGGLVCSGYRYEALEASEPFSVAGLSGVAHSAFLVSAWCLEFSRA
jgi:hypothetical protein